MAPPHEHRWIRFLREAALELRRVTWPTRGEVITYTIVVIVTVCVLGAFVFGLDVLLSRAIQEVFDG